MNYQQALDYIYSRLPMFTRIGAAAYKADLTKTRQLCDAMGNPERAFPSLHIAGTNGKGSVSAFLSSILMEEGRNTGLFTSPHLKDFRERIRVNGEMISEEYVTEFVSKHQETFEKVEPSFFEVSFAMACSYFKSKAVDCAVMEAGMGGRLDSTNLVRPVLTLVTNIGMDHMQFLGDTPAKIAAEKAGIFKSGIPAIVGEKDSETAGVFEQVAHELGISLRFASEEYFSCKDDQSLETSLMKVVITRKAEGRETGVMSPLLGQYQLKNLVTVMAAVDELNRMHWDITEEGIRKGIQHVIQNSGFGGRWQRLNSRPAAIADIAHNAAGIREVMAQVSQFPYRSLHIVLGMVSDKDSAGILPLFPAFAKYYFCRPDIPRGREASQLAEEAAFYGLKGGVYRCVSDAYQAALESAASDDLVLVTGSAFVVAEVV